MPHDAFHQPLAQAASSMRFKNEHIAQVCDRGEIADHACEADLYAATIINAKAQRMLNRSCHDLPRNSFRPVTFRQEPVNHVQIETGSVRANQELSATGLDDRVRIGSLSSLHQYILTGCHPSAFCAQRLDEQVGK